MSQWREIADASMQRILEWDLTRGEKLIAGWIVELSYRRGRESVLVAAQGDFGKLTGMDEPAVSRALSGLRRAGVLHVEGQRNGAKWFRLLPNGRLVEPQAVADAATVRQTVAEIERVNELAAGGEISGQRRLKIVTEDERLARDQAEASALLALERRVPFRENELAKNTSSPPGNLRNLQDGTGSERFPVKDRAPARAGIVDSYNRQIDDSGDSGSCGSFSKSSGPKFRDEDKNFTMEKLVKVDRRGELRNVTCLRTWVGRVRDFPHESRMAVAEVETMMREGKQITSPLGKTYSLFRQFCIEAGKALKMML